MKKFFSLFMLLFVAIAMNAQVQEIKFTEAVSNANLASSYGDGTFKLNVEAKNEAATSPMDITKGTRYFGTSEDDKVAMKVRFRTRGKSSDTNKLSLTIPVDGTLTVFACSGGSTKCNLTFKQSEVELQTVTLDLDSSPNENNIFPVTTIQNVNAGKVDLVYSTGCNFYYFKFTPTTDGINNVVNEKVINDGKVYTLQGTRTDISTKGILISNGKKFVNK